MKLIESITWRPGEVEISYSDPSDLRVVGDYHQPLLRTSQLVIPEAHPSYPDIRELYEQVQDIVRDVLEDFEESPQWRPPDPDEDDDDDDA